MQLQGFPEVPDSDVSIDRLQITFGQAAVAIPLIGIKLDIELEDHGVDRRRKRLLIPLFNANERVIVQLEQ
jgi:hypothetical protein